MNVIKGNAAAFSRYTAGKLKVRVYENRSLLGAEAARMVAEKIKRLLGAGEEVNIIFAAAPSQNEFLSVLTGEREIEWQRVNAFHMDEYIGLLPEVPQSFGNFLKERIFDKLPFKTVHYINGNADDPEKECVRYERLLRSFPAHVVCMGIGENNHIAFNDPHVADFGDSKWVKVVDLDQACRQQQMNDDCFEHLDQVPAHAITLTVPALMAAEQIFCMVPGKNKAKAIYNTLVQPVKEKYPSTILRNHPNAVLFADRDSADLVLK